MIKAVGIGAGGHVGVMLDVLKMQRVYEAIGLVEIDPELVETEKYGLPILSQDKMAEILVADTGGGMPPETLGRIFDPFFSTKSADSEGQGGTGLGLSLCREIIEAHQGRIRVESAVGRGTRFTLRFPLVASPSSAAA